MEHISLTFEEFRYLRKHKINLETRFHLKIIMPEIFNHFGTVATAYGAKQGTQNLRNLLKRKTGVVPTNCVMDNPIPSNPVPLITLSDTENETSVLCETQKKRKKNKKKCSRTPDYSSPIAVVKEPTIDKSPENKRRKTESTSLAEVFIPLRVTSVVEGVRSVELTSNTNSQEADESIIIIEETVQNLSSSSKENDDSVIVLDTSTVQEVPDPECLGYVIDKRPIIEENTLQYNSSVNDDSIVLLDTVEEVPRPAFLGYTIDRRPIVEENTVLYNSSAPREDDESIVLVDESPVVNIPQPVAVRLRPIVIDGSNIAREHGKGRGDIINGKPSDTFSCRGIQISVDFFVERGHTQVTVFLPKFRKHRTSGPCPSTDVHLLDVLELTHRLSYTPSRRIEGRLATCYDDRFIVQLAACTGGVILSNDNYKDIMDESESFKKTVQERLLMFCFVGDMLMVPEDPSGRNGPRLKELLAFPEDESPSPT